MDTNTAQSERQFAHNIVKNDLHGKKTDILSVPDVFTEAENDILRHIADDIAVGKTICSRKRISIKTHWSETEKLKHRGSRQSTKSTM